MPRHRLLVIILRHCMGGQPLVRPYHGVCGEIQTTISYYLPQESQVWLEIYDVSGRIEKDAGSNACVLLSCD